MFREERRNRTRAWRLVATVALSLVVWVPQARADGVVWTWMKGANTTDSPGTYGTQGVPNTANSPSSRWGAASWTDEQGSMWLFGGVNYDAAGGAGLLNDLWKYDPAADTWTWMKGARTTDTAGVYGEQGVSDPANAPGSRYDPVSWIDTSGSLWLFGGRGMGEAGDTGPFGHLSDLWRYEPARNSWTWMKGFSTRNEAGVYGVRGTSDSLNTPGGRMGAVSWMDASGELWLFGGLGRDSTGLSGYLNDLWKYNQVSRTWTWMRGATTPYSQGVYGDQGTSAAANVPAARYDAVSWADGSGFLWLFGGFGSIDARGAGLSNDLWRYELATNSWTWMKGSSMIFPSSDYGTQGVPHPDNTPGGRRASSVWTDSSGALWLFGGMGGSPAGGSPLYNDLWRYEPSSNMWTWVNGANTSQQPGVYGQLKASSNSNTPGSRRGCVPWVNSSGTAWLFGGFGLDSTGVDGYLNDLWRLSPPEPTWWLVH